MRTQFQSPGLLSLYTGLVLCIPAGLAAAAGQAQQPATTTATPVETAQKHSHKVVRTKVEAPRIPTRPQRPVKQLRPK